MFRPAWPACVVLAIVVLLAAGAVEEPAAPVLTLEDVVRWHVAGISDSEILRRVRDAVVDFDVSDEMLDELRGAGLSPALIAALVERQRELHPPAPPPAPAAPASAALVVRLHGTGADAPALRARVRVPPEVGRQLRLEEPEPAVADIALYVACLRAPHVPDHWRSHSPLGRDFTSMPRHEILAFVTGARRAATNGAWLELELPASIELSLDPAESHDLSIGIAVRVGDRYLRVASDTLEAVTPGAAPDALDADTASAKDGALDALAVRFRRPTAAPAQPSAT